MGAITRASIVRVGVDLAKNVIQLHAANGAAWARRVRAIKLDSRLIAASFVSPYRMEGKSGKNDMTDAAAVCEAG